MERITLGLSLEAGAEGISAKTRQGPQRLPGSRALKNECRKDTCYRGSGCGAAVESG